MKNANQEAALIREILIRELETINTYQNMLDRAVTQQGRDFLTHIIEEEKEHVAEAIELIKTFDPAQAALFGIINHYSNSQTDNIIGINKIEEKPRATPQASFTVGSLRNSGKT